MKFSNGFWLKKEGLYTCSPTDLKFLDIDGASFTAHAACKPSPDRGDTINEPLLAVRVSAPFPDVVRVQLIHFIGGLQQGPAFELAEEPGFQPEIRDDDETVELTSGGLTVRLDKKGPWNLSFLRGEETLTASGPRAMGYMTTQFRDSYENSDRLQSHVREQLALDVGECIYGLGERFAPFVKNGQTVEIWNEDGGTACDQTYKNVPFYLSSKGYGVFVNHPERVSVEVGTEVVSRVQFSVPGEMLDYFIIGGTSMKDVLGNYTRLTGRPALPPAWSFGLWLTTSFTPSYDEGTVNQFIQGMADRNLPLSVFHFDCFWMKDWHLCDLTWDERVFPDPEGMLARLKQRGLKICVWINPYISQKSKLFLEGMQSGYLLKRPNGAVWQIDMWQPGMALVDFSNPDACAWFAGKLGALVDMGVDCFKTDFGERVPTDVAWFDGSDPMKMHNYYTHLYNRTVFDLLKEKLGEEEAVVFARSATAGGQQFPVHWGGDCSATYESMAESLRGGLSLCLSGFAFWSHDISGFESRATPDLYKRWVAFGLLSTHSRLHGSHSYRVPWLFDEEAVDVLRRFTQLKCALMPYLYAEATEAPACGVPLMRAMVLEFGDDPACDYLDRQYMLGGSLLVAPIFNPNGQARYYLPKGKWTNFLTGATIEGGSWKVEKHDYMSLPLMVRPNSVIAVGSVQDKPDYDFADNVELQLYEIQDGCERRTTVTDLHGNPELTVLVTRKGKRLSIVPEKAVKPWRAMLKNMAAVDAISGARFETDATGIRLMPVGVLSTVEIDLT